MAAGPGLYSRVVAVLKVGLPLVAVGLLASLFLVQTDDRLGGNVVFSPGDVEALGSGLSINNPTFTGTTRGEDRFRFTADAGGAGRRAAGAGADHDARRDARSAQRTGGDGRARRPATSTSRPSGSTSPARW